MEAGQLPAAYQQMPIDAVRRELETPWLARLARRLLVSAGGTRVLELGCGAGVGADLGPVDYTGLDFRAPPDELPGPHVRHDLRHGLGPVGRMPFDLYLAGFGLGSHLTPAQLRRLLAQIARHGRPGSIVALEALGLYSLEWPRVWGRPVGPARTLTYRLGDEVPVHPWAPAELAGLVETTGMRVLEACDRTVQAGPKTGGGDYWPGLPSLRTDLAALLAGRPAGPALTAALPPLPAGAPAATHQRLAAHRRELVTGHPGPPRALAREIWALERGSGGGFGHGLMVVARVP